MKIERDRVAWFCHSCDQGSAEKYDQPEGGGELGRSRRYTITSTRAAGCYFRHCGSSRSTGRSNFVSAPDPTRKNGRSRACGSSRSSCPELIDDLALEHVVFVVEGERDVLTLRSHGVPATCNPMGAGKWWPEFNDILAGADVVICGDNDEPGRNHVAACRAQPRAGRQAAARARSRDDLAGDRAKRRRDRLVQDRRRHG